LLRVAVFRRFHRLRALAFRNLQEPRRAGVHSGHMTTPRKPMLINSASACRAKAASLRREAKGQISPIAVAQLLEIAGYWDRLAVDYESTEDRTIRA